MSTGLASNASAGCSIPCRCLAAPDAWSWNVVRRALVVNVGSVARVSLTNVSGDGDGWAGVAATAVGDADLSAGDVELRNASRPWVVNGELLNSQEVFTAGDAGWDVEGVGEAEVPGGAAVGGTPFLDLEPLARAVVGSGA